MIKYILLAAVVWAMPWTATQAQSTSVQEETGPPVASWQDVVEESIDATYAPDMEFTVTGAPVPSDLTLDPDFLGTGMSVFYPYPIPDGATLHEDGLRVFPYTTCTSGLPFVCFHSGYYVAGRVKNTDGTWREAITRRRIDGTTDTTFGDNGWMFHANNLEDVVDAVLVSDRMYILSTWELGSVPVMRVTCTDLTDGSACFIGFQGMVGFGASPSGPIRGAYASRIVYDARYGLFIAGRIKTDTRGWEMAVARLDMDGGLVDEFHDGGTNTGLPPWGEQTDADIEVLDLAVTPEGTPGGARLYVAGTVKRSGSDYDGFVLGLSPVNGYTSAGWPWQSIFYEDDNMGGWKKDAITAITVQRNGRLAMAGWSETNTANERSMILARYNADGSEDSSFCDGDAICKRNSPWPGVVDFDLPAAIAEREGNRDLVIAVMSRRPAPSDPRLRQKVVQFSSNGNVMHAQRVLDYPAGDGVTPWSRPYGMWIGHSGVFGFGGEVIAIVGTRRYNAASEDFTLGHLVANDSIFADQFGGLHSD